MESRVASGRVGVALTGAGVAFLLQVALSRAEGVPVPSVVLPALFLALLVLHGGAALLLGQWPRPHALALLLGPPALALLPFLDRKYGAAGLVLTALAVPLLVGLLSALDRAPSDPIAGAIPGAALATSLAVLLVREADPSLPVSRAAAKVATVAAVVVVAGLVRPLRTVLGPAPRLALTILGVAGGALLATPPPRPGLTAAERRSLARPVAPPPAVLVVVDTLRADHLKGYGYSRDTMPSLERFASEEMVVVDRAIASGGSSLPSHGSMFTGLLPTFHGGHGAAHDERESALHPMRGDVPTLAQLLGRAGYWTVGVSANCGHLAPSLGAGRGFSSYSAARSPIAWFAAANPYRGALRKRFPLAALDSFPPFARAEYFEAGSGTRRADATVDEALAALEEAGEQSFFLFVNLFDPHVPYRPPVRAGQAFPWTRPGAFRRLESQLPPELVMGRPSDHRTEIEDLVAMYDSEIRFVDSELDRLLRALRAHPRFGEMLIVVTSDHGEAFGEHGHFTHGTSLHDEVARVPLLVKPGVSRPERFRAPGRTAGPFQSVDLFPTFLAHAGLSAPAGIDGLAWAEGRDRTFAEEYAARWGISPEPHEIHLSEAGGLKALVSTRGETELYDVAADPMERRDLSKERPEVLRSLDEAFEVVMTRDGRTPPPAVRRALPSETTRSLRALGYLN